MVSDKAQEAGSTVRRFGEDDGPREPGTAEDVPNRRTLRAAVQVLIASSGKEPTRELEDEIIETITGEPPYGSDSDSDSKSDGELTGG